MFVGYCSCNSKGIGLRHSGKMILSLIHTFICPCYKVRLDFEADCEDTGCQKLNEFVWCMLVSMWYVILHFRKWDVGAWTGSIWLRIGTGCGLL